MASFTPPPPLPGESAPAAASALSHPDPAPPPRQPINKAQRELVALLEAIDQQAALISELRHGLENTGIVSPAGLDAVAIAPCTRALKLVSLALSRPRVGVGVVIRCGDRLLIGQRHGSHGEGLMAFPGGHLEFGEPFAECASRELEEEVGVLLPPERFRAVYTSNDVMLEDGLHYVTVLMFAEFSAEESHRVRNMEPEKCLGWIWATLDELRARPPASLFPSLQHFLRDDVRCGGVRGGGGQQ